MRNLLTISEQLQRYIPGIKQEQIDLFESLGSKTTAELLLQDASLSCAVRIYRVGEEVCTCKMCTDDRKRLMADKINSVNDESITEMFRVRGKVVLEKLGDSKKANDEFSEDEFVSSLIIAGLADFVDGKHYPPTVRQKMVNGALLVAEKLAGIQKE